MTTRYNGFIVVLEQDIRDDDAESTINAIRQIKGVLDVVPQVADATTAFAEVRARTDLLKRILQVLEKPKRDGV